MDTASLLALPVGSLGHAIGRHLRAGGFDLLPRLEDHDVFHVVTGLGTSVEDEVALQWLLVGSGKRSAYCIGTALLGTLVFPECLRRFWAARKRGAEAPGFWRALAGRRSLDGLHRPLSAFALPA